MRFVDTNVLLYAVSTAKDEREKKAAALALLDSDDLAMSVQVLQEFYVQATHAARQDRLDHETAIALVESWLRFHIQDVTVTVLRNAFATSQRWQVSYWDAESIEAAREAGCATLYSEDLQDGMDFAGVRVVNPFGH